jgi:hypothetical protein
MDPNRTLVMACATVIEEILPLLPKGMQHRVFDFGLHINPARLRNTLQEAIDSENGRYETIILGYGMCSLGIIGLKATNCRLVAPRVDDCIALFLGSREAYKKQFRQQPGTYYLTKGWIEVGDTPFSEHERNIHRYGEEKAKHIYHVMMGAYRRLALINTGQYSLDIYREYAKQTAKKFGLQYEEMAGSNRLIKKMLAGDWNQDFVVIEPGESFTLSQFLQIEKGEA